MMFGRKSLAVLRELKENYRHPEGVHALAMLEVMLTRNVGIDAAARILTSSDSDKLGRSDSIFQVSAHRSEKTG
jgi:hypothetical protein